MPGKKYVRPKIKNPFSIRRKHGESCSCIRCVAEKKLADRPTKN